MTSLLNNAILIIVLPRIRGNINGCKVKEKEEYKADQKRKNRNRVSCGMK